MGWSSFLMIRALFVLALLALSVSNGFGRKLMATVEIGDSSVEVEESGGESRKMAEVMDYEDPEPNKNPKTGYIYGPPPQG